MAGKFWIINVHTRACFGPYVTTEAARWDIEHDAHPEDWRLVAPVRKKGGS